MVDTLVTKLLRRGGIDEDNAEEDDTVNTSYEEIEELASPRLIHFDEGETIDCHCISGTVNSVLSMSLSLSLNLP
jgi:hypothetical protein